MVFPQTSVAVNHGIKPAGLLFTRRRNILKPDPRRPVYSSEVARADQAVGMMVGLAQPFMQFLYGHYMFTRVKAKRIT